MMAALSTTRPYNMPLSKCLILSCLCCLMNHITIPLFANEKSLKHCLTHRFATVSKKVNVKRLKVDIWTHLDELEAKSSVSDRRSAENSIVTDQGGTFMLRTVLDEDTVLSDCRFLCVIFVIIRISYSAE